MTEAKKKLPFGLIFLLVVLGGICVMTAIVLRDGFETFEKFQPDTENITPSVPTLP